MNQKGFANIILIVVIVILVGAAGYFAFVKKSEPVAQQPTPTPAQTKTPVSASYEDKLVACKSLPNNSTKKIVETSRLFINLPKDVYPYENIGSNFSIVSGNATAGYISNGGLPGQALEATPECWSTYFDFEGNGEVDLKVKSAIKGMPDYFVRFIVGPTQ